MSISHVLVSGGNGLLGRATIQRLVANYHVTSLVRQAPQIPCPGVDYLEVDLSTDWDLSILPNKCDLIIHVAQSNNYKEFPNAALEVFDVNLTSTLKLLEYGRKLDIQRFVLASTGGLYAQNRLPLNENSELFSPDKLTHYLATKLSAEIFARNFRPFFNVDMLRIFFMYGPRQKLNMLIPKLIGSIQHEVPIMLAGNTGIRINPIYVEDVVSVIQERVHSLDSEVFNVAGQQIISIRGIAEIIGRNFRKTPQFISNFEKSEPDLISDIDKCASILNRNFTKLEDGLAKTCKWFETI